MSGKRCVQISVLIDEVEPHSLADRKGVCAGDTLISVNSHEILDFLDYRFYLSESKLRLVLKTAGGKMRVVTIRKGEYEDVGLIFHDFMMDRQKHCKNKCIFCFIDQLPPGLRETLYFKDDDARMSFLFGNYITLTNLTERDVERIIEMHISPVNISVHTTDPELRVKMMRNKHAGEALSILYRLADARITINTQLVLCPGINDGNALRRTLNDLSKLYPAVQMIAAVPLGVTKYREGLPELEQYTPEAAANTLDIIETFAQNFYEKNGVHFAWAADEFYLKAGRPLPEAAYYEDFAQLENGVGMCSLMKSEFRGAVLELPKIEKERTVTLATGAAAYEMISKLASELEEKVSGLTVRVHKIKNLFFGETITVSGLIVGQDLITQLQGVPLGEELLIPRSMLRSEGDLFLDDISLDEVQNKLRIKVTPVTDNGYELVQSILGSEPIERK